MKRMKAALFLGTLVFMFIFMVVGCSTQGDNSSSEKGLQGTVVVVGSTSVTPVAQDLADAFGKKELGVKIEIQGVGSSAGIKAVNEGAANIGMSSRNLKEEEKDFGLQEHTIAYDGIAIAVHPSNDIKDLTPEDIEKIYKGEITNWKEVGGQDAEIVVVSREEGSGTRGAFEELMGLEGDEGSLVKEDVLIADGNGAVKASIATKENAIGYLSLTYLEDDSVKAVTIDGVDPTVENVIQGKYKISRPFLMLSKGELSKEAQAYLDFIMSEEGQEVVAQSAIPVN